MPTANELVSNRPLRGDELHRILMRDVDDVLSQDHTMASHVAYGRVSYEIRVSLHFDNPSFAEHVVTARSKPRSDNEIEANPELSAVEWAPPLRSPSGNDYVRVIERSQKIESPNLARIANGLPVTIVRSDGAGHSTEEGVHYPSSVVDGVAPVPVDTDLSRFAKAAFHGDSTVQLADATNHPVAEATDAGDGTVSVVVPSAGKYAVTVSEEDRQTHRD